jgi:RecB family endonuclease NucS
MTHNAALHKTSHGWGFTSEAALENFIWENLTQLFGLKPLKRQHNSCGEICDILAVDENKRLVILELKNAEDRYLIQQLTRYHANLLEEKPFSTEIDYSRPTRLVAIAPSYHRHNLIDKEHSRLYFELLQFSVEKDEDVFSLVINGLAQDFTQLKYVIPYQPIDRPEATEISAPPELLIKWLGGCTEEEREGFLKTREKILASNLRMKEIQDKNFIQYGMGKTRSCAEICFQKKSQRPILFLWLPTPSSYLNLGGGEFKKYIVARVRIWTDGKYISHVAHTPEGLGKMKTLQEWNEIELSKRPRLNQGLTTTSHTPVEIKWYLQRAGISDDIDLWDFLPSLAIEKWMEKL